MNKDRLSCFFYSLQYALCFTKTVSNQHAGLSFFFVLIYPFDHAIEYMLLWLPVINREAKSRFRDKRMTSHRFEHATHAIIFQLIVATCHPHLTVIFNAHL